MRASKWWQHFHCWVIYPQNTLQAIHNYMGIIVAASDLSEFFRLPLSVASPLLISTHTAHSPFRDTSGSVTEFVCKHSPSSPSTHPFLLTSKLNPHNRDRWLPPNRVRHIVLKYQRSAGEYWCSSVCPCLRDQTPLAPTFPSLSLSLSLFLILGSPFSLNLFVFKAQGIGPNPRYHISDHISSRN